MSVAQKSFGTTKNGEEVTLYTITNKNNVSVSVIDYGANLVSLMVPDKNGNVEDIVLGFDNVAGYEVNGCFFGAFIGRHGNLYWVFGLVLDKDVSWNAQEMMKKMMERIICMAAHRAIIRLCTRQQLVTTVSHLPV